MVYERVFFITAVLCFSCLCWSIASPRPSERKTRVSDPRKVENVQSDGGSLETEPFALARFKRFEKEWPNGMSKSGYEAKAGKSLKGKSHFFRVCSFDICKHHCYTFYFILLRCSASFPHSSDNSKALTLSVPKANLTKPKKEI